MKNVFVKLLAFLILLIAIDWTFGKVMNYIFINTQKGDWGRNNYISNELESDIIILGSSRAIHHYDSTIFANSTGLSCYNCGEDGMGIILMYARYKLVSERKAPRLVIYDFISTYDYEIDRDDVKYLKFLRPFKHNITIDSIIYKISPLEITKLYSNLYTYNSIFLDIIAQFSSLSHVTASEYTYSALSGVMNYLPHVENEKKDIHNEEKIRVLEDSVKIYYMNKLIKDCQNNGTKLVFVISPRYGGQDSAANKWLIDLCSKHSLPLYNHYSDSTFCINHEMFADSYHLNYIGAEAFSLKLVDEIFCPKGKADVNLND